MNFGVKALLSVFITMFSSFLLTSVVTTEKWNLVKWDMKDVLGETFFLENIKRKKPKLRVQVSDCELCYCLGSVGTWEHGGALAPCWFLIMTKSLYLHWLTWEKW